MREPRVDRGAARSASVAGVGKLSTALTAVALAACTSTVENKASGPVNTATQSIDAAKFCDFFVNQCSLGGTLTIPECESSYRASRFTAACVDEVAGLATCADLDESFLEACFPKCPQMATTCNADGTVSDCRDNLRLYTLDCAGVCATRAQSWTGECGTAYGEQTAESPKCWCEER